MLYVYVSSDQTVAKEEGKEYPIESKGSLAREFNGGLGD